MDEVMLPGPHEDGGEQRDTSQVLKRPYFLRPTLTVARDLIGKYLVRHNGGEVLAGKIVEVEAYVGTSDRACHASKGRTARTEVMFGPPGVAYVYLIYGMYHCLNVVTEREGFPAAVLIRAMEVDGRLIDGPGRLCRLLKIDRSLNGLDLTLKQFLWFEDRGVPVARRDIDQLPRIGVDYAGEWARKPWRFRLRER
ncbi:MAG: DNA-3-methyladenine glycosylase [Nitrospira sp.]|nr:DNA-3-methyladenine glycosylase [Nitrospira sp.]